MEVNVEGGAGGAGAGIVMVLVWLTIMIFAVATGWKVFAKAGKPGWGIFIPIYNVILMLGIAGRPVWWILLMFIPIVSIVVTFVVAIDIAKNFGKSTGFGIGLALIPFIFYPILAFGSAEYMAGGGEAGEGGVGAES